MNPCFARCQAHSRCRQSIFTLLLVMLSVSTAFAQEGLDLMREAEREVAELEYERAAELLREVVVLPELPTNDLVRARSLLGKCDFILGNLSDARLHYRQILDDRPDFKLPAAESPKIKNFFRVVKEGWERDQARGPSPTTDDDKPTFAPNERPTPPPTASRAGVTSEDVGESEASDDGGFLAPILIGSAAVGVAAAVVGGGAIAAFVFIQNAPTIGTIDSRVLR